MRSTVGERSDPCNVLPSIHSPLTDVTKMTVAGHGEPASAPRYPHATQPAQWGGADVGMFLLLNGILCCTADRTGQFRPADVFGGLDRVPLTPPPAIPTPSRSEIQARPSLTHYDAQDTPLSIDSDCPIFNTFGILSGGVLINSVDRTFVDFTDTRVYTPATAAGLLDTVAAGPSGVEGSTIQAANARAFRLGKPSEISPEAVLTFCTSETALPPPSQTSKDRDLPTGSVKATGGDYTSISASTSVRANVEECMQCMHLPVSDHPESVKKLQRWKKLLGRVERFRRSVKVRVSVTEGKADCSSLLPSSIPFPFHHRGYPIPQPQLTETRESNPEMPNSRMDDDGVNEYVPSKHVRSSASSFTCFSGIPFFTLAADEALWQKPMKTPSERSALRLGKRLRPYHDSAWQQQWLCSGEDTDFEEEFLEPFREVEPRKSAFFLFIIYFCHFGIRRNGKRLSGEQDAYLRSGSNEATPVKWSLCPDSEYNVREEVENKRIIMKQRRERHAALSPSQLLPMPSATERQSTLSSAWDALHRTSRRALWQRLTLLMQHLHELHEETLRDL